MMQQTSINFDRAEQLALIRGAQIPAAGNVKADKLKAVLRVIDDHAGQQGWCYASQATIAREACMSLRSVERAIAVLRDHLGLILTVRKASDGGTVINHTRVVWSELALLCEPHRSIRAEHQTANYGGLVPEDQTAKTEDQTAKTEDQTAKTEDQTANVGGFNRKRLGSAQEAPPPPTPSWSAVAEELSTCGVRMVTRAVRDAQQRGHPPDEVLAWCREYRRCASHFDGPAALVWRIREGCWPVEVPDAHSQQAAQRRKLEAEHERLFGLVTYKGRRLGRSHEEITRQLHALLPEDFLASRTW